MPSKLVGFIHTTPVTIGMVEKFMKRFLPDVEYIHIYNGLIKKDNFSSPIGVTPKINLLRYANYAYELEKSGCSLVVSCCSLMPRATEYASKVVNIPVIQLDSILHQKAIESYSKIGVEVTTEYVIPYVRESLESKALAMGKKIEIIFSENTSALELFNKGEFERYEMVVIEDMKRLEKKGVDCILMGQIPFAVMEDRIKEASFKVPVLFAGEVAFKYIAELLK
ncbi:MAG: aspartate/glutamate racemase family protein [Synergistetes bacterium]|nr:aspartate/glutamate racemase family protein [Synergistota bacterium]MCX8127582.1 aspartate/glutamate racemase family protein [Synergistota bacterium]MDW8191501.1 aspartate/glutamate racemase family protein [Synergistota bacterium]